MSVGFNNIHAHIVTMDEFKLKWRFTDEQYDRLPDIHLEQLKPLDEKASRFLWDFISESGMHLDVPFKKDFFRTIDKAKIQIDNQDEIRKWLYRKGLPFEKEVFLSWQPGEAMIVPWKLVIKYFDSFYYSDDLTIVDQSLQWALLFYHEDEIYFGTNTDYTPNDNFEHIDFIW